MTSLTVVIAAFNARDSIGACLESLAAQPMDPARDEVIVADDASADGTAAFVAERYPFAKVIRLPANVGSFAARNAAIDGARGDIVAFVDSDCVVLPGWAAAVRANAAPAPTAAVLMGRVVAPPSLVQRALALVELGEFLGAVPRRLESFASLNVAFPAALLRAHRFDGSLRHGGDRALSWSLHRLGHEIRFIPDQAVVHAPPADRASIRSRRRRYAETFVALRRRDPSLPGARLVALGPLAAPLLAAARLAKDLVRLVRFRRALGVTLAGLVPLLFVLVAFRSADLVALARALAARRPPGVAPPGPR